MDDEIKLHREMSRGAQARNLLDDEMFKEALAKTEAHYLKSWRETPEDATAKRERLWLSLKVMDDVVRELQSVAQTGKLAQKQIEQIAARKQKRG